MTRKHLLTELNPRWITSERWTGKPSDQVIGIIFECPEGHHECEHMVPFTPSLDGTPTENFPWQRDGAHWQRTGDTFETLSLSPSIARRPRYPSREAAIAAGCIPEYVTDTLLCALHIFINAGRIDFCSDSR